MTYREHMRAAAREYLRAQMHRAGGNMAKAAREIGVQRSYVYKLLNKHGLFLPQGGQGRSSAAARRMLKDNHA